MSTKRPRKHWLLSIWLSEEGFFFWGGGNHCFFEHILFLYDKCVYGVRGMSFVWQCNFCTGHGLNKPLEVSAQLAQLNKKLNATSSIRLRSVLFRFNNVVTVVDY